MSLLKCCSYKHMLVHANTNNLAVTDRVIRSFNELTHVNGVEGTPRFLFRTRRASEEGVERTQVRDRPKSECNAGLDKKIKLLRVIWLSD